MNFLSPLRLTVFCIVASIAVAETADEPKTDTVVVMDPLVVSTDSQLSFGFSLQVMRQEPEHRVLAMYVGRVREGTDAHRKGLRAGAQILSIDGKAVGEYEGTFRSGSDLHRIFIGRTEGARVALEILPLGKTKAKKITIVRQTIVTERPKIGGMSLD